MEKCGFRACTESLVERENFWIGNSYLPFRFLYVMLESTGFLYFSGKFLLRIAGD